MVTIVVQYIPTLPEAAVNRVSGDEEEDMDNVLRQEILVRSLSAQHKLDLMKRRNLKRKKPSLPLMVGNRILEETVRNFQRKLRKVNYLVFFPTVLTCLNS